MKKECVCCGKTVGALTAKIKIADGVVCNKCWEAAGYTTDLASIASGGNLTATEFMTRYEAKQAETENAKLFTPTKSIGAFVAFDDNSNTLRITHISGFKTTYELFDYAQIVDFELLEDGESITKGGLGRAVVGDVLFGGIGAVVGGVTAGKKTKGVCTSLRIKLTIRNDYRQTAYIDFINSQIKTDSALYKKVRNEAQEALSVLQLSVDKVNHQDTVNAPASSAADELLKFKQLLDMGAITQDEFDIKKKQLLGL